MQENAELPESYSMPNNITNLEDYKNKRDGLATTHEYEKEIGDGKPGEGISFTDDLSETVEVNGERFFRAAWSVKEIQRDGKPEALILTRPNEDPVRVEVRSTLKFGKDNERGLYWINGKGVSDLFGTPTNGYQPDERVIELLSRPNDNNSYEFYTLAEAVRPTSSQTK